MSRFLCVGCGGEFTATYAERWRAKRFACPQCGSMAVDYASDRTRRVLSDIQKARGEAAKVDVKPKPRRW